MIKYCLIKDGSIFKYNVNKPKVLSVNDSNDYRPIEDNVPTIDTATQRIAGSSYEVLADKVVKSYQVVDIPQKELMEAKAKELERDVQAHINTTVKDRGYDDENSIAKYLVEGNPFEPECKKISLWIGNVWTYTHQVQADIQTGTREIPTAEELIAELPTLEVHR